MAAVRLLLLLASATQNNTELLPLFTHSNNLGYTVLHCLAILHRPSAIKQLLASNTLLALSLASIETRDPLRRTPLHLAVLNGGSCLDGWLLVMLVL
ncbi:hypothetical protein BC830DRAFT_1159760 [Chytriomyces sp. MP71]|nr:hypothetical protein BC830DRAFT_1159760 [Chytriomyces sp. MP71]